jgi:hypothetical protein
MYVPPDMTELSRTVHQKVRVGMSATEAAKELRAMKLDCSGKPYVGSLSCSRMVQPSFSLAPLGCVARVRLTLSPDDDTVREIQGPQAACTGL